MAVANRARASGPALGHPAPWFNCITQGYKSQSKIDKKADLAEYDSKRTQEDRKARYIKP